LPSGISSLTLNVDGVSCAVGTMAGQVVVYDLRQTGTSLASMYVQGDVKSLRFSPPPKHRDNSTATTPATLNKAPYSSAERNEMEELRRDLEQATLAHPPNHQHQPPPVQRTQKHSSLFSAPQHHINMQSSSLVSEDPQRSYLGPTMDSPRRNSNRLPLQNSNPGSPQKFLAPQSESSSYAGVGSLQEVPSLPSGSPSKQPSIASESVPPSPQPTPQDKHPDRHGGLQGYYASEKRGGSDRMPGPASTQRINVEEIRDVVRDEVEKLQDDLEESLRNMHMDMIRQFHLQSQELNTALSSQLAAMDQLREENQRLREENDFLKRHQQQNPPRTTKTSIQ
jgi:hypothetical protein